MTEYIKLSRENGVVLYLMLFESNFNTCPQRLSREISIFIRDCLRKDLNVAGLLPEAKLFEILRRFENVLKIVETFFFFPKPKEVGNFSLEMSTPRMVSMR